jgi:CMP-N,N'-diacetyllegionaminic acid synthase
MKILYLIPARGGSKGIIGKNIKLLGNKPLIQYSIECARNLTDDTNICVSTDSAEIINEVEKMGLKVPFVRPNELATDVAGSDDVIRHALNFYESGGIFYDTVILLQPTSPFRVPWHVRKALELYNSELDMVVSVKESPANPYYSIYEEDSSGYISKSKPGSFYRRQDCPKVYELNGAIYIIKSDSIKKQKMSEFKKVRKFVMDGINSIDIDTKMDWDFCEFLLDKKAVRF